MVKNKSIKLIVSFCLLSKCVFGALGGGIGWDVSTTGNDLNGGGFDSGVVSPGTDQSVSGGVVYTDIVLGSSGNRGTSVAHPFSATTNGPGNVIRITGGAGCTQQWVTITNVTGVTANFDRSIGSETNVCSGNLGNPLLTIQQANTNAVQSNRIYIRAGTYTFTTTFNVTIVNIKFIGYQTTHDDYGTKPLITTATNSTRLFQSSTTQSIISFVNISFSNTAAIRADGFYSTNTGTPISFFRCVLDGFNIAINTSLAVDKSWLSIYLNGTEIKNSVSHGIYGNNNTNLDIIGSWIHNNGGDGVNYLTATAVGNQTRIINSIISDNAGEGVYLGYTNRYVYVLNSVFRNNVGAGFRFSSGFYDTANGGIGMVITNSIFYGNTTYGIIGPAGYPTGATSLVIFSSLSTNNAYGANGVGAKSNFSDLSPITLTASPFVSATNFALNSTTGGGALLRLSGYPGLYPGDLFTSYVDIGTIQTSGNSPASSATGSTCIQ